MEAQLQPLIKQITETGEWSLDRDMLKKIKSICKRGDANVETSFMIWFAQLKTEHAQIRYSCVQLAEELFQRSHRFRELLADEFPAFLSLTVGIQKRTLPPPPNVAAKLKQYALALVKSWHEKYAALYRPLGIGYDYLLHQGFLAQGTSSLASIHASHDNQTQMRAIYQRRMNQIKREMEEHFDLMKENLNSMEGVFDILVPRNEVTADGSIDFDALMKADYESGAADSGEKYREDILSHGLASNRYKIEIDLSEDPLGDVHESDENKVLYEQLRESHRLLVNKHMPMLNTWIKSLGRMDHPDRDKLLKQLLSLKTKITHDTLRKSDLLGIEQQQQDGEEDDYLEELFEDVPLDGSSNQEPAATSDTKHDGLSTKLPPAQRIFPLAYEPGLEEDVTYNKAAVFPQLPRKSQRESNDQGQDDTGKGKGKARATTIPREELLKMAPVVERGDDLYYWDKSNVQFNSSGLERQHRFMGTGEGTNEMPEKLLEQLTKRATYYKDKIPNQLPACRAPLRNGKLCPRRDLVTCPFHGKIIPRDEIGQPIHQEDQGDQQSSTHKPLWEDIEGDVMRQQGQEQIDTKRKKRKRQQNSNLIDIRQKKENSYTRLQKKLETPGVRRMVEEAQDYERSIKSRNRNANIW
ncbi:hypothetical protein K492DRAFT_206977 [Lichtheimia hyalospora FSU 10163]|nr:hypothetical protein K492DRAFT_206977 [Lichtheimia hyalospora FSU 10163]